jgi:hypothetical protein
MKIQIGEIILNKTKKYLAPCLNAYGKEFTDKLNAVFKVGIGIGDMILINNNIQYEQHIFILIDTKLAPTQWKSFIKWIKKQDMFEDDYSFDNISTGQFHMVIIKLPESCYKAAQLFKKSQFSKMFSVTEVEQYFINKPDEKGVLIKDDNYRIKHTKILNEMFGTTINPEELEGEFDFPVRKEDEMFK